MFVTVCLGICQRFGEGDTWWCVHNHNCVCVLVIALKVSLINSFKLLCFCSLIDLITDDIKCGENKKSGTWTVRQVCHWCSYHIFITFDAKDTQQHAVYNYYTIKKWKGFHLCLCPPMDCRLQQNQNVHRIKLVVFEVIQYTYSKSQSRTALKLQLQGYGSPYNSNV